MKQETTRLVSLPSYWIQVENWRMHYRTAGAGPQAIVLVHGLTVCGNYLLPAAAALLDNFVVYVPDIPGFGASEKPRRVLNIVQTADVLAAWMEAVGLQSAYLLGNSLGCHTVTALAVRHPQRVTGAILESPVGDPGGRNFLRLVARGIDDFVYEPPSLWAIMFQDFLKAGLRRTLLTLRGLLRFDLEAWLPQSDTPALVVGGGQDRIVPAWWINRVAALLPQGRATVIEAAGHVPNFSHPEPLAALVRCFVDDADGRQSDTVDG